MNRERLIIMLEIAILAALSVVLGYVKFGALWAMGGSISLIMVPIFIMAFRRGLFVGLITGFIVGVINLLTGGYVVHPVQLVLDYPVAFTVLGFAGIMAVRNNSEKILTTRNIILGVILGASLRFISHFISGIVWFGQWAPDGWPVALYSFVYNISYLAPESLITVAVIILINRNYPQFFQVSKK
ncbi:energy-coupled thiamine transporter ThiT [Desulfuribacillus alkaliarsenatis]|uniref:Energy-coupled thiamine transporter ThiT n=1 Tax=Desulfuribacillus alkaliarsenatis TaxID=766136 RepID=A0A1E5G329_9FIRM|nr:energy-coupled thiamine transporter ThiT [Desulfuribacillus alkaliarsenatis]OEF97468.1 energy-coupled thiamine transporter ThiT [Desulfuribacillus alkaliarsenatis]